MKMIDAKDVSAMSGRFTVELAQAGGENKADPKGYHSID